MHEVIPGARAAGEVLLDGQNIYDAAMDPVLVRRRIGMVFQKPNPFPTKSIFENVAAGLRIQGAPRSIIAERVERSLRQAALWDEVKDKLNAAGHGPVGRPAAAALPRPRHRRRAGDLLMDEPASALDPIATLKIEDLMLQAEGASTRSSSSPTICSRRRASPTTRACS